MSTVGRYKDADGRIHWAATESAFAVDGLADGSLVDIDAPDPTIPEPPRSGAGSGVEAWREYGVALGIDGAEDMSRDQLVRRIEAREVNGVSEAPEHGEDHDSGDDISGSGDRQGGHSSADGPDGGRADQPDLGR